MIDLHGKSQKRFEMFFYKTVLEPAFKKKNEKKKNPQKCLRLLSKNPIKVKKNNIIF